MSKQLISAVWGKLLGPQKNAGHHKKIEFLKEIPLFERLDRGEFKRLSHIIFERTFEDGEHLFQLGQPGAALFIVKAGVVEIVMPQGNEEEIVLAKLGPGEFLGELALLDNSPRSASARAAGRTETLAFFRSDLDKLMYTDPGMGCKIYRALAMNIGIRLRSTDERLRSGENGSGPSE